MSTALVSMLWWLIFWTVLLFEPQNARHLFLPPATAHGLLMVYGTFGSFIFGFLSTVFPRWQGQDDLPDTWRLGALLYGIGYISLIVGLYAGQIVVLTGVSALLAGYLVSGLLLLRTWLAAGSGRVIHAGICLLSLLAGLLGLIAVLAGLLLAQPALLSGAIQASIWLYLLPIYLAVTHRMIPFFSRGVIADAMERRPDLPLALMVAGALGHMLLWWVSGPGWLWVPDGMVLAGSVWLVVLWQPWRCLRPPLLGALHIGFLWLPVSMLLSVLQSLGVLLFGEVFLPRAPLHALTIGFFGTLMVAMVSRVTLGHSGRALVLDRLTWGLIWVMQLVVFLRVFAELPSAGLSGWYASLTAAGLWSLLLLLWGGRYGLMLLHPRIDGRPG